MEDKDLKDILCLIFSEKLIHIIESLKEIIEKQKKCTKLLRKLYTLRKLTRCETKILKIKKSIYREDNENSYVKS